MSDNTTLATAWLQGLASRGVTVTVRNNRLWLHPASAYRNLTDDEVLTLRHHRDQIKALVREGKIYVATTHEPAPATAPRVEKSAPCAYCYQSPCIGREHSAFSTLHALDPEEVKHRDADATAVMMKQFGKPSPWL